MARPCRRAATVRAEARIRNAGEAMPCWAEVKPDGRATLTFDDPQYGVSAGQAAVLYNGTPAARRRLDRPGVSGFGASFDTPPCGAYSG